MLGIAKRWHCHRCLESQGRLHRKPCLSCSFLAWSWRSDGSSGGGWWHWGRAPLDSHEPGTCPVLVLHHWHICPSKKRSVTKYSTDWTPTKSTNTCHGHMILCHRCQNCVAYKSVVVSGSQNHLIEGPWIKDQRLYGLWQSSQNRQWGL